MSLSLFMGGCSAESIKEATAVADPTTTRAGMLLLPELEAAELNGAPLQVVATTSIIGDVAAQVGGEAIELTTLMGPGQDPHSYEPGARELTAVADADVIFVNGWNLEEALVDDLQNISENVPVLPISANITPLIFGGDRHEDENAPEQSGVDPHVWFNIDHVEQWAANAVQVFSALDPANAETYERNAAAYLAELEALKADTNAKLAKIPAANRLLVTNHDALSYFANAYDFELIGTVIPSASALAEPSAADLAGLIAEMETLGVCTIFTETTVSDALAQTAAAELEGCAEIKAPPLYTGAIGPPGSGAESYIEMYRANVDAIVAGLQ